MQRDRFDDPRLTSYVLGELPLEDRNAVEDLLRHSAEARAEVDAIRTMAGRLTLELQAGGAEPTAAPSPSRRSGTSRRRWMAVSAAVPAAMALMLAALTQAERSKSPSQLAVAQAAPAVSAEPIRTPSSAPQPAESAKQQDKPWDTGIAAGDSAFPAESETMAAEPPVADTMSAEHRPAWRQPAMATTATRTDWQSVMPRPTGPQSVLPTVAPYQADPSIYANSYGSPAASNPRQAPAAPVSACQPACGCAPAAGCATGSTGAPASRYVSPSYGPASATPLTAGVNPYSGPGGYASAPAPTIASHVPAPFAGPVTPIPSAEPTSGESYGQFTESGFISPLKQPLSTFSIDVDTASYSNVRRFLQQNQLPPHDAVRIEELLNYFDYDYAPPTGDKPFAVHVEVAACPWNTKHRLARVAIQGKEIPRGKRPPSNLVFLIDVSGSMRDHNKLPLVKAGLKMLVEQMTEDDRVAIVTYSDAAKLVLDSTGGNDQPAIGQAIENLQAGGATNGEGGIQLAYQTAVRHFYTGGTNRVILCTDGDFNVGVSDEDELVKLIRQYAGEGVFLSVFGFGMGNLKDARLETLADRGNGHYGYVDGRREAKKVFVEDLAGTLVTIAKDVKLQIEFNPAQVGSYRLIGYENRALAAADFNNDQKDAGELGAGRAVTALYEIVHAAKSEDQPQVDALKYQRPAQTPKDANGELMTVKLRYKQPDAEKSQRQEIPVVDETKKTERPSRDFEWAASVAAWGLLLRNSNHKGQADYDLVLELAAGAKGPDKSGRRAECLELMQTAKQLGNVRR